MTSRRRGLPRGSLLGRSPLGHLLPLLVLVAVLAGTLHHAGVGYRTIVVFLVVEMLARVVPGVLLWRALRGGRDPWPLVLPLGTLAMHAAGLPWYLLIRWCGLPELVWALPVAVVLVVAGAPRLRSRALEPGESFPVWFSWHVTAATGLALFLVGAHLPSFTPARRLWPGTDAPYLVALAAELKHHFPPTVPFVAGEPLKYHWLSLADVAATSWLSGRELDVLTIALTPMSMVVLGLAGFAALGARFAGRPVAGVVAIWLAVVVGSVNPFRFFDSTIVDGSLLMVNWIGSPTQGYAEAMAMALLYVLVGVLRSETRVGRGDVVLVVLLSLVLAGAKATFVPVLGGGALVALLASTLAHRGQRMRLLLVGVLLAIELVLAQVLLFRGAKQGLSLSPSRAIEQVAALLGFSGLGTGGLVVVAVFLVVAWLAPLLAASALVVGAPGIRDRADPALWFVAGMAGVSLVPVLLLTQPGFSQFFFLRAGLPFATLLVAGALVLLWDAVTPQVRRWALVAGIAGLASCLGLRWWGPQAHASVRADVLVPLVVLVGLVLLVLATAAAVARPGARRSTALLVAGVFVLGLGAYKDAAPARFAFKERPPIADMGPPVIPHGGVEAARFVRARSSPDELIATNAHCWLPSTSACKNTAHWMAGWTERRAVVEGWGYTDRANRAGTTLAAVTYAPFWDQALLRLNDRVFLHPSRSALDALTRRYDVRWLVVDRRFPVDLAGLRALLPRHRRFGQVTVFEVRSAV